ncbi:hypothetical protein [Aureivirga marina]|uniref:hypothetical protein n=1 Tax=Aureivirga marina TaxID=1182451 RepID=UPI0018CB9AC0|nr:hypothetical protein [Aureivirga marina]
MKHTFILILLFILSFLFLFVIQKKGKKSEVISFISTIIATLIGVWLAITLTNSESLKKEKEDTVKLLQSSIYIIKETSDYTSSLNEKLNQQRNTIKNDSIKVQERLKELRDKNPIPYPDLFEVNLSNDLITKNVSEESLSNIYNILFNLKKTSDYKHVKIHQELLLNLETILLLEIQYQKEEIDLEELEQKIDKI